MKQIQTALLLCLCLLSATVFSQNSEASIKPFLRYERSVVETPARTQTVEGNYVCVDFRPTEITTETRSYLVEYTLQMKGADGKPFTTEWREVLTVPGNALSVFMRQGLPWKTLVERDLKTLTYKVTKLKQAAWDNVSEVFDEFDGKKSQPFKYKL